MRLFFIPGLGEETWIFDKIQPFTEGEKIFIDNWTLLADVPEKDLTVLVYAKYLVERYGINKQDVVVGHSMGGWIALHIKHLVSCRIIQIASWTDMNKVSIPVNKHLLYWSARKGLGLNPFVLNILVFLKYRRAASKEVFIAIFKKLMTGDKTILVKQLKVIFNPVKEPLTITTDLRIHAKSDQLVRPPDQPFHEVPGDHFTLYTYPEAVYTPVINFLKHL